MARDSTQDETSGRKTWIPYRFMVALLGAFGLVVSVGSRKSLALILTHITSSNSSTEIEAIIFSGCVTRNTSLVEMRGDTMFLLYSANYAGNILFTIPGTALAMWLSPTRVVGISLMLSCAMFLALPWAIPYSIPLVFLLRLVQGILEAVQQPGIVGILSAWCTKKDKAILFTIFNTGSYVAPVLAAVLTGLALCFDQWTVGLFVYGGVGVMWSAVWLAVIYDTPNTHPRLDKAQTLLHHTQGIEVSSSSKLVLRAVPWCAILTSPPVWAIFIGSFCKTLIYTILLVGQPQFYYDSFGLATADIGVLSTLPHIGLSISCILGGLLSDKLLQWGMSTTRTRKLLFTLGHGIEGLCLIGLYFSGNWRTAVTLASTGVALGGLSVAGFTPLPADLAPQYASVIGALSMTGRIGAVVSTVMAAQITGTTKTLASWQKLFLISGIIHLVGVVLFDLICKAELQPWAGSVQDKSSKIHKAKNNEETDVDMQNECNNEHEEIRPLIRNDIKRQKTFGSLLIEVTDP